MQNVLVTGGAGFIGANFVLKARLEQWANVVNLDKLTYASNSQSLAELQGDFGYNFVQGDISDKELVGNLLEQYQPHAVINFATKSHVDGSISRSEWLLSLKKLAFVMIL